MFEEEHGGSMASFWDVDGYKKTVKRTEDGLMLCNELMKLIQERAEIEKKYADKLRTWGKKWNEIIEKSPAYGTTKEVLKGSLKESEKLSEVHIIMKDRLLNIVSANIADWKAENYKKQLIGCKPAKTFEEEFQRAQKPWAKKLEKTNKVKKDYHNACRIHRMVTIQEAEGKQRTDHTPDQIKKLQEKKDKCKREAEAAREKYARAVDELSAMNGKYMEDMTLVFSKTQDFDRKRIEFFREILHKLVDTLDQSQNQVLSESYQQFHKIVDELDPVSDLKLWSENHGVDMSMVWPRFEEFVNESLPDKGSKLTGDNGSIAGPVAIASKRELPAVNQSQTLNSTWVHPSAPDSAPPANQGWNIAQPIHSPNNPFDDALVEELEYSNEIHKQQNLEYANEIHKQQNLEYANKIYMEPSPAGTYSTSGGIPVLAVYDYEGQEEDELSFKAGEKFTKLCDADDQGWCTGSKDGKMGLYPESYAQPY